MLFLYASLILLTNTYIWLSANTQVAALKHINLIKIKNILINVFICKNIYNIDIFEKLLPHKISVSLHYQFRGSFKFPKIFADKMFLKSSILFSLHAIIAAYDKAETSVVLGLYRFLIVDQLKLPWDNALQYCADMNMTLFTPNTEERTEKLSQFFTEINFVDKPNIGNDYIYWTSGKYDQNRKEFIWYSTGEQFNYTNWLPNMPDNWRGDEFCVEMGFREVGKWNDNRCIYKRHFICEHLVVM
ncbi:lectin subunit alpha-like [Bactrocera neohumeralis]|uniref:lectin subunit alpha-like n=1 Tax=Bactrocera tryoni TaxID=59916 RepID=UPI001A974CFF|nr:lectin subunit alpha-like [Bactrocera tryoni]XP_050340099.1 lectin subunit alpha-like [Bactrocera neohumeralis]